jgi:hypothetical protein
MKAVKRDNVTSSSVQKNAAPAAAREVIAQAKARTWREYSEATGEHARLLRLALNEAEALAWQSGFPHLFFPVLAAEKAQATVQWHRRQRAVRRKAAEIAFAE